MGKTKEIPSERIQGSASLRISIKWYSDITVQSPIDQNACTGSDKNIKNHR